MYRMLDKLIPKLRKKIRNEYNFLSNLSFDELNVVTAKEITVNLFERLMDFNRDIYLKIIKYTKEYAYGLLNDEQKERLSRNKIDDEDFLDYVLASYNNVTCYLYKKEALRKRLRLSEEILTAREFLNRKRFEESLRRSANLWFTQSIQYGIEMADKTSLEIYKRSGIKKVKWITSKDQKVCGECKKMSNEIFDIDKVPSKAHYNCRCHLVPV